MSSGSNWKPWWEKVADYDSLQEREAFLKGVAGVNFADRKTRTAIIAQGILSDYLVTRVISKSNRDKGK